MWHQKIDSYKITSLLFQPVGHIEVFFYALKNLHCLSPYEGNCNRYVREVVRSPDEAWVPSHAWYI